MVKSKLSKQHLMFYFCKKTGLKLLPEWNWCSTAPSATRWQCCTSYCTADSAFSIEAEIQIILLNFLLILAYGSKLLFFLSCRDTYVCRILCRSERVQWNYGHFCVLARPQPSSRSQSRTVWPGLKIFTV